MTTPESQVVNPDVAPVSVCSTPSLLGEVALAPTQTELFSHEELVDIRLAHFGDKEQLRNISCAGGKTVVKGDIIWNTFQGIAGNYCVLAVNPALSRTLVDVNRAANQATNPRDPIGRPSSTTLQNLGSRFLDKLEEHSPRYVEAQARLSVYRKRLLDALSEDGLRQSPGTEAVARIFPTTRIEVRNDSLTHKINDLAIPSSGVFIPSEDKYHRGTYGLAILQWLNEAMTETSSLDERELALAEASRLAAKNIILILADNDKLRAALNESTSTSLQHKIAEHKIKNNEKQVAEIVLEDLSRKQQVILEDQARKHEAELKQASEDAAVQIGELEDMALMNAPRANVYSGGIARASLAVIRLYLGVSTDMSQTLLEHKKTIRSVHAMGVEGAGMLMTPDDAVAPKNVDANEVLYVLHQQLKELVSDWCVTNHLLPEERNAVLEKYDNPVVFYETFFSQPHAAIKQIPNDDQPTWTLY